MTEQTSYIPVISIYEALSKTTISWTSAADLLHRLIHYPADRHEILIEVQKQGAEGHSISIIYHPLLNDDIVLHSQDTDQEFLYTLYDHWNQELRKKMGSPAMKAGF